MATAGCVLLAACRHPAPASPASPDVGGAVVPEVFAPGAVSGENVWKGSFTPDGDTLYYFRHLDGAEHYGIFASRKQRDGHWTPPARVPLGGDFSDLYPAISPDGRRLVFTSYRPIPGVADAHPNAFLWMATRARDGSWGPPIPLVGLGVVGQYHSQTAFDDEGSLYFRVSSPGERMDPSYVSRWTRGGFEEPIAYAPVNEWARLIGIDTLYVWGGRPTPDRRAVVLEVSRLDERHRAGPADLWMTCLTSDARWTIPRPLPEGVNTATTENFIFFSPRGDRMFFVRGFRELLSIPTPRSCDALPPGMLGDMALPPPPQTPAP